MLVPTLAELPEAPKRIIMHWTAGGRVASAFERGHYHYLVEQTGNVVAGLPVRLNCRKVSSAVQYAAHTRGMNSYSVGVAFCGMRGAVQGGTFGPDPLTEDQVDAGCRFIARLCAAWDLTPNHDRLFTHSEAERIHGVKQVGKWDIDVLAFRPNASPQECGDYLRGRVAYWMNQQRGKAA